MYLGLIRLDGFKTFMPKTRPKQFQEETESVDEIYNETKITEKEYLRKNTEIKQAQSQKTFYRRWSTRPYMKRKTHIFFTISANMILLRLIRVFQENFTPSRNIYHIRGDKFVVETMRTGKHLSFKNLTPAELMASKFNTSTVDAKLHWN